MIDILGELQRAVGRPADAASMTGNAHAKLTALMPLIKGTVSISAAYPPVATGEPGSVASGNGSYGSYDQIVAASVLAAHQITGFTIREAGGDNYMYAQFAVGGAGSEVVVGEVFAYVPGSTSANVHGVGPFYLRNPLQIPANARVAMRYGSNGVNTCYGHILVDPRPVA